ncbi:MAG: thiamine-phosphate kinase [Planctomycetota bacterium]
MDEGPCQMVVWMNAGEPHTRGELELIRRIRALLEPAEARDGSPRWRGGLGFGDDMAPLEPDDPGLLWTVDMLMDGVDFDSAKHDWQAVGWKALAVNLSDCAAMAATPVAALCAVALSERLSLQAALDLVAGVAACGRRYGCPLVGGDTNSWGAPTAISISVAGRCEPGCGPVRRDGARSGDGIWLTGPVGGSILGRHMTFEPRLAVAREIARTLRPHAMIDISDGLALDLTRILEASGCGAVLAQSALDAAIHPDAHRLAERDGIPARTHALQDGEDFELIVVLPADAPPERCAAAGLLPLGQVVSEGGLLLDTPGGRTPIAPAGWEHFT